MKFKTIRINTRTCLIEPFKFTLFIDLVFLQSIYQWEHRTIFLSVVSVVNTVREPIRSVLNCRYIELYTLSHRAHALHVISQLYPFETSQSDPYVQQRLLFQLESKQNNIILANLFFCSSNADLTYVKFWHLQILSKRFYN